MTPKKRRKSCTPPDILFRHTPSMLEGARQESPHPFPFSIQTGILLQTSHENCRAMPRMHTTVEVTYQIQSDSFNTYRKSTTNKRLCSVPRMNSRFKHWASYTLVLVSAEHSRHLVVAEVVGVCAGALLLLQPLPSLLLLPMPEPESTLLWLLCDDMVEVCFDIWPKPVGCIWVSGIPTLMCAPDSNSRRPHYTCAPAADYLSVLVQCV
jgi:hypothetical protein